EGNSKRNGGSLLMSATKPSPTSPSAPTTKSSSAPAPRSVKPVNLIIPVEGGRPTTPTRSYAGLKNDDSTIEEHSQSVLFMPAYFRGRRVRADIGTNLGSRDGQTRRRRRRRPRVRGRRQSNQGRDERRRRWAIQTRAAAWRLRIARLGRRLLGLPPAGLAEFAACDRQRHARTG